MICMLLPLVTILLVAVTCARFGSTCVVLVVDEWGHRRRRRNVVLEMCEGCVVYDVGNMLR